MGTHISRVFRWGNRRKVTRVFAMSLAAIFMALSYATLIPAPEKTSAAEMGAYQEFKWINDATIRWDRWNIGSLGDRFNKPSVTFTDSNPLDTNRSFKSPAAPSYCNNADAIEVITLKNSPALATILFVTTPEPVGGGDKVKCDMATADITITDTQNALIQKFPCENRPGTAQAACERDAADGNANFAKNCTSGSTDPLCTATPAATAPGTRPGDTNADGNQPDPCDSLGGEFALRWLICPALTAGMEMADGLDGLIEENLHYDTTIFDTSTDKGKAFYNAWITFRSIALVIIFISGLVMVVSQAAGLEVVSAYTFKKMMPNLFIAVIGIVFAWPLLDFVVTLFNDLGHWSQDIIMLPFQSAAGTTGGGNAEAGGIAALLTAGALGATAYLAAIGPIGIASLVGTALIFMLIVWLILVVRILLLTALIITSPIAIALYILPNTRKVSNFWQNTLTTLLVAFPAIMVVLGVSKALSLISDSGPVKLTSLLVGYAAIPFIIRFVGGAAAQLANITNNQSKGLIDRMSNARNNSRKRRMQEAAEGRGGFAGAIGLGALSRRSQLQGFGLDQLTKRGRSRYSQRSMKFLNENAHKMVEGDHGRGTGDDEATGLAVQGMGYSDAVNALVQTGMSQSKARERISALEAGLGAKMGSDSMRKAAFQARLASGTGYTGTSEEVYGAILRDGATLINDGLITNADAMSYAKANAKRADINGVGAGTWLSEFESAAERMRTNPTAPLTDTQRISRLRTEALRGSNPGMVVGGRHEAITSLAPQMLEDLNAALEQANAPNGDDTALARQLAMLAGRYDAMAQVSPQNAEIMANEVMSQVLVGARMNNQFTTTDQNGNVQVMNVQRMIEQYRNNPEFSTMRREYTSAAAASGSIVAQAGMNGPPPPNTQGPMAPPSDRRLKRAIKRVGTLDGTNIPLYSFKYKFGKQTYVGIMAQDILSTHPEAVLVGKLGFYRVDYSQLGTRMYTLEEWRAHSALER